MIKSHLKHGVAIILSIAAIAINVSAMAQTYPNKPVSLLVPYPPGGLSDVIARMVSQPLSQELGQTVIVENLGGASGSIAAQKLLNSPADGYTIFQGSPNELILAPLAIKAIKFKSEDFKPVAMIGEAQMAMFGRKGLPVNTLDEFVAYVKKKAAEGKPVTYASVGIGSFYHLLGEQLSKTIGADMMHVPYKGGAPANQALIGDQVDIFITPFGKNYEELSEKGMIKLLGVLNKTRTPELNKYPVSGESVALKDFVFTIWTGYFVKNDTPKEVVDKIHLSLNKILSDPKLVEGLKANSLLVPKPTSLEELAKQYQQGIEQFRTIAKSINLQPE